MNSCPTKVADLMVQIGFSAFLSECHGVWLSDACQFDAYKQNGCVGGVGAGY